ncbi:MAG: response regulator [bacterium]|nr:response regulator [bacterium]
MNDTLIHILIVDDEQEVTAQVKRALLSSFNCAVDIAYNGKEALDKMEKESANPYDLLILDILIPKLNGMEVCQAMIKDQTLMKIPILLVSILPLNSDDFQKSLNKFSELAMVRDVLEKPFSDEELLTKVKKIL